MKNLKGKRGAIKIGNQGEAQAIAQDLDGAMYQVGKVTQKERRSRPAAPFITSTLQQEAWRKLRFTAQRTMSVAQQLYEGISVGGEGPMGLITYMRTDSTTVASSARAEASDYIKQKFGPEYTPKSARVYTRKVKGAQEAHEAIRPTSILREPEEVRRFLTSDQARLYDLIWRRMLASQMADAVFDATSVSIDTSSVRSGVGYEFRAAGSVLKFPGFRVLYLEDKDDAHQATARTSLPISLKLAQGDLLDCLDLLQEQHFTQPPPGYTEASSGAGALEEQGIGRPSTYAPIIATVLNRDYVHKDKGRFVPSKLGTAVSDLLTANFPDIMDVGFTARVEEDLDEYRQRGKDLDAGSQGPVRPVQRVRSRGHRERSQGA